MQIKLFPPEDPRRDPWVLTLLIVAPQFPVLHGEEIDDFNILVTQLQGMYETVATTGFDGDDGVIDFRWNREA